MTSSTTREAAGGTTTTRTTRATRHTYWERRPAGALPWVLGAAGLLGLGLAYDIPVRHSIESDLEGRAAAVLADAPGVTVDFTGRDGVLGGTLPPGADPTALIARVESLDGVRMVTADFGGAASGEDSAPGGEATSGPSAGASEAGSAAAPSAGASGVAGASPSVARTSGATPPSLTAVSADGRVTLSGKVPSEDARAALVAATATTFGADGVVDRLTIDDTVSSAGLVEFGRLAAALGTGSAATATLDDGSVTLTGSVADEAAKGAVESAALAAAGDQARVSSQLAVGSGGSGSAGATTAGSKQTVQAELDALPQITFQSGGARLSPAGARAVRQTAAILTANPSILVRIEGHTDDVGDAAANLRLSTLRAKSVRAMLHDLGIAHERMSYIGYGESRPKVANISDANRAANRRVQLDVL